GGRQGDTERLRFDLTLWATPSVPAISVRVAADRGVERRRWVSKGRRRAKAKRERRLQGRPEDEQTQRDVTDPMATERVLTLVAEVHRRFESSEISFEEFEETKAALLRQLHVE